VLHPPTLSLSEHKVHQGNINKFGSKLSENIYHLHYKDEQVNAILAKNHHLFLPQYKTNNIRTT